MGSCTRRHFLLSTCFLQMITVIERQVFDFLGYMWAPICVNFFHIIFVIFGFYGAYHFRIKYIITYLIWNFVWIAWNSFLICFYLNVGELDRDSDLLNLGTGSVSWFEVNGYGCKPTYPTNITSDDPFRPIRPERVDDCLLDYHLVEVTQSGIQCALAVFGIFGAILISTIFLDEDDRFDFMNGDAKSPQHTVVHPMYVSYTSIPTSASATLQSNKQHINYNNHNSHHQQQQQISQQHHQTQQQAINQTTYLTYTNSNYNSSSSRSYNKNKLNSSNIRNSNSNISSQLGSKHNTLTRVLYPQKNNRISASTTSIITTTSAAAAPLSVNAAKQDQLYYDDSTAKADQMFTNSNRRQQQMAAVNNTGGGSVSQQKNVLSPSSSHGNTTSSLSYASLQNSNLYLPQAAGMHSGRNSALGGGGGGMSTPLSNSNFSLNSNNNINAYNSNSNNNGRFARIHTKPRPPKSTSYSSFINHTTASGNNNSSGSSNNIHRPDIKYTQMGSDRLSRNFDENLEDDNFSLHNFKNDDDITYVPFQKPTPSSLFISKNNNPSYTSINSFVSATAGSSTQQNSLHNESSNNNSTQSNFGILLEHGAILEPAIEPSQLPSLLQQQPIQNPANRFLYQQNGLPFAKAAYSPTPYRAQPKRPTNIPLPTVPTHAFPMTMSPSDVTPPPPPAPRPHIFQPRSGNAPYPDLSPEVTEKYAMPTQYLPRSPVAIRIARRQRTQRESERTQLVNNSANFCDQIRDTPPRFTDNGNIVRARSQDRLSSSVRETKTSRDSNAAPHVNRRSGRRDGKARPRSYCNSLIGGEGVIRTNISADRNKSNGMATNAIDEYGVNAAYLA